MRSALTYKPPRHCCRRDRSGTRRNRSGCNPRAGPAPPLSRPPAFSPSAVKLLDRGVVGRAERDMRAGAGRSLVQMQPERRLALRAQSPRRNRRASTAHSRAAPAPPCRSARWRRDRRRVNPMWSYMMFSSSEARRRRARPGASLASAGPSRSWKILRSPREAWRNFSGEAPAARWKVRTKLERSPKPTS